MTFGQTRRSASTTPISTHLIDLNEIDRQSIPPPLTCFQHVFLLAAEFILLSARQVATTLERILQEVA
jgi:hypothetical protein